jgi:hypothetical protein
MKLEELLHAIRQANVHIVSTDCRKIRTRIDAASDLIELEIAPIVNAVTVRIDRFVTLYVQPETFAIVAIEVLGHEQEFGGVGKRALLDEVVKRLKIEVPVGTS